MALAIEMVYIQMLGLLWNFLLSSYPFLLSIRIFLWRHEVGREPYCKIENSFWMHHHVCIVVAKKKGNCCEVWHCLNSFSRKHKNLAREMACPVKHLVCQSDDLRWSLESIAKAGYREPDVVAGICNLPTSVLLWWDGRRRSENCMLLKASYGVCATTAETRETLPRDKVRGEPTFTGCLWAHTRARAHAHH